MQNTRSDKKRYTPPVCLNHRIKAEPMLAGTEKGAGVDIGAGGEQGDSSQVDIDLSKPNIIWRDHPNSNTFRNLWEE